MADIADEELKAMFQQGNTCAFELLFEKYRGPIFTFLCRMLNGERQPAEDLLQEIFVKLLRAKDLYEPRAKFSTWLFAIARNHCLNFLRSRRYQGQAAWVPQGSADDEDFPSASDLARTEDTARDAAGQREMQEMLERAVRLLPDDYKEVFLLRAVQGFTHEQIAQTLKMNPATVRTHYHRAKRMLRESIGGMLGGETPWT